MLGTTFAASAVPLPQGLGTKPELPPLADFRRTLLGRREKIAGLYALLTSEAENTHDLTARWLVEGETHLFYTQEEEVVISRRQGFTFTEWLADGEYFRGVEFVDGSRDPEILYQGPPHKNARLSLCLAQVLPVPADIPAHIELTSKNFDDKYILDQGPEIFYLGRDFRVSQVDVLRGESALVQRTLYDEFEDLGHEISIPRGMTVHRFDLGGKAKGTLRLRIGELTLDQAFPHISTAFWEDDRG